MWATGEKCGASGLYRSRCGCRVSVRVPKNRPFPDCPICGRPTRWTDREVPTKRRTFPPRETGLR